MPHIGWVFVNRLPVTGPTSRKSVSEAKRGRTPKIKCGKPRGQPADADSRGTAARRDPAEGRAGRDCQAGRGRCETCSRHGQARRHAQVVRGSEDRTDTEEHRNNDLLAFLTFVEHHTPGSSVNAIVENYSSHGAYVRIGDVKGYVPLSLMSDPPPRSAREFMKIGESITLVVESFAPTRRSIDLAIPTMTTVKVPPADAPVEAKPKRARKAATKALPAPTSTTPTELADGQVDAQLVDTPAPKKRTSKKAAAAAVPSTPVAAKPRTRGVLQPRDRQLLTYRGRPPRSVYPARRRRRQPR